MSNNKKTIFFLVVILAALAGYVFSDLGEKKNPAEQPQILKPLESLTIQNGGNIANHFLVKVVKTRKQKSLGLMYRESMEQDQGMLFSFAENSEEVPVTMWMKNTHIPLDMFFINKLGIIVRVEVDAKPKSLARISSGAPVWAVLELNAGISERLNIKVGDRVIHPIFAAEKPMVQ